MSAILSNTPSYIFLTGNASNLVVQSDAEYTSIAKYIIGKIYFPTPATYDPYWTESEIAFTLEFNGITLNFYSKTSPNSALWYELGRQENYEDLEHYLAHVLIKFNMCPTIRLYYDVSIYNNTHIKLDAKERGTDFEIIVAAEGLIGVADVNDSIVGTVLAQNPFWLGLKIMKNSDPAISVEKSTTPQMNDNIYEQTSEAGFDITPYIAEEKNDHFSYPEESDVIVKHTILDEVFLIPYEKYGDPLTEILGTVSDTFLALQGKFSDERFAQMLGNSDDFLDSIDFDSTEQKFLTFAPRTKKTDIYAPEKLYFIAPADAPTLFYYRVKKYYAGSNDTDGSAYVSVNKYDILEVQCSYNKLFSEETEDIYKYEIWFELNSARVSEVFTFEVDRTYRPYIRYYLMLNSYGVYDCVRTYGEVTKILDVKKDLIEITDKATAQDTDKKYMQASVLVNMKFEVNSGYADVNHIAWLQELMVSPHVLLLCSGTLYPVTVKDSSNKMQTDGEYLPNIKFTVEGLMHDEFGCDFVSANPILPSGFEEDTNKDFQRFSWQDGKFTTEWNMLSGNFTLPLVEGYNYNFTVEWGDGTQSVVQSWNDANATHFYEIEGTYQIMIAGLCEYFCLFESEIAEYLTKIIEWGNVGFTRFYASFQGCNNLIEIPDGPLTGANSAQLFSFMFSETSIVTIPENLFERNILATTFYSCFYQCFSLTSIPSGLFDKNTLVTDFSSCFSNCSSLTSIPSGLFDKNTLVTDFSGIFSYCSSITPIPSGLFDKNVLAHGFSSCFYGTAITSIPTGLFDKNVLAQSFYLCFCNCASLESIPSGLFDNNTIANSFTGCFKNCTSLVSIPLELFDKVAGDSFGDCFYNAYNLSGNAPELWADFPGGTGTHCFYNDTGLTNYASIPSSWK